MEFNLITIALYTIGRLLYNISITNRSSKVNFSNKSMELVDRKKMSRLDYLNTATLTFQI